MVREMIKMTDNLYELRKFVLEDLIKEGYKYIARDKDGRIYAYSYQPTKLEKPWLIISDDGTRKEISSSSSILTDIKWEVEKSFEIPYVEVDGKRNRFYGVRKD